MANEETPSRRGSISKEIKSIISAPGKISGYDKEKERVKFQIGGGDLTPLVDDNAPLMESLAGTPKTQRSISTAESISLSAKDPLHQVFVELFELHLPEPGTRGEAEWEETARWIRYEEDIEGADQRWGRPHVPFLSFHSLLQLRYCLAKGALKLGAKANSYAEICEFIVEAMSKEFNIDDKVGKIIYNALKRKHKTATEPRHLSSFHENKATSTSLRDDRSRTTPAVLARSRTTTSPGSTRRQDGISSGSMRTNKFSFLRRNGDSSSDLMKKLSTGAESVQVFVGKLNGLHKVKFCMLRLDQAVKLPEILDAPIPVKFVFVVVGPPIPDVDYHEIGRAVATLMSNPDFNEIAYDADTRTHLLIAVDQFLDGSLVIPPGDIEKKNLLSVEAIRKALRRRCMSRMECERLDAGKRVTTAAKSSAVSQKKPYDPLQRTRKCFAGVVNDVKHRFPWYWSDIRDAFHFQCVTSLVFMFFAAVAPAISFGGLLGEKVDNWMGPSEVLVAQALCGVVWGLFSCQPLLIMAATGPVLIFEESLYAVSKSYGLEFMVVRVWTSFWILFLAILTVAFEGSFLVRCITRFTEDIFATLISLIFCYESFEFLAGCFKHHPVKNLAAYCFSNNTTIDDLAGVSLFESSHSLKKTGQPDTALLSTVFLLATFTLAFALRQFRTSLFLGRTVRRAIGDFGVPIAMAIVVIFDELVFSKPYLETLNMPPYFSPSDPSKRGWFIDPMGLQKKTPVWVMFAAVGPALLVYILFFVEIEITELLLATKERGLRKGSGFHYDLVLIGILAVVCSLIGLPWMCAAAVQSLAHASSLTIMKCKAPGERPEVEMVLEQRVTTVGVALLTGSCAFLGFMLRSIPLATLFGIFLYLGVINMIGVQFLHRIVLVFMPQKHHPDDVAYCTKVRLCRMHFYTGFQVLCLILLWIVKAVKFTSLTFPFIIMLVCLLRKFLIPRLFTSQELKALDGHEEDEDDHAEQDFYQEAILPL